MCINVIKMVWNYGSTFYKPLISANSDYSIILYYKILLWCLWSPSRKQKWSLLIFSPARMSSIIHSSLWAWHCSWRKYLLMTCDNTKCCCRLSISVAFLRITCGIPKLQMCWRCERITDSSLSIRTYWLHTLSISWTTDITTIQYTSIKRP